MNAYVVRTTDLREYIEPVMDDGSGPRIPYWPTGVFAAATPAQAKADALRVWSRALRSGVYEDDWPNLRVRLLGRDVGFLNEVERGELDPIHPLYEWAWNRVHEVLDHAGASCDCPVEAAA